MKLRNPDYCDGCEKLIDLQTLSQIKQCSIYKINMTEQHDAFLSNKGIGYFPRPDKCKEEDKKPNE